MSRRFEGDSHVVQTKKPRVEKNSFLNYQRLIFQTGFLKAQQVLVMGYVRYNFPFTYNIINQIVFRYYTQKNYNLWNNKHGFIEKNEHYSYQQSQVQTGAMLLFKDQHLKQNIIHDHNVKQYKYQIDNGNSIIDVCQGTGWRHIILCKNDSNSTLKPYYMLCNLKLSSIKYFLTKILSVQCGDAHSIYIDYNGNAYAQGNNAFGQCGFPQEFKTLKDITLIHEKVHMAFCLRFSSIIITKDNQIYSTGYNEYACIGHNIWLNKINQFTQIHYFSKTKTCITQVRTGYNYCTYIDKNGVIYFWGRTSTLLYCDELQPLIIGKDWKIIKWYASAQNLYFIIDLGNDIGFHVQGINFINEEKDSTVSISKLYNKLNSSLPILDFFPSQNELFIVQASI